MEIDGVIAPAVAGLRRPHGLAFLECPPGPRGSTGLQEVIDGLLEILPNIREALEAGNPDERKAVVRAFLADIRIEKATRQAILRWYRLPRLDDVSLKLVELRGAELEGHSAVDEELIALPVSRRASKPEEGR